ncbi:hypothetical protein HID58_004696 [Brassica napus]|uniref:Transmembrane protein n=1 Tax=Brassica napus TaxID=3708 RepID=A0ABQ8E6I0_BRANA|nr:hypothetical protein HID58_004696 [Brassica napus]
MILLGVTTSTRIRPPSIIPLTPRLILNNHAPRLKILQPPPQIPHLPFHQEQPLLQSQILFLQLRNMTILIINSTLQHIVVLKPAATTRINHLKPAQIMIQSPLNLNMLLHITPTRSSLIIIISIRRRKHRRRKHSWRHGARRHQLRDSAGFLGADDKRRRVPRRVRDVTVIVIVVSVLLLGVLLIGSLIFLPFQLLLLRFVFEEKLLLLKLRGFIIRGWLLLFIITGGC